MNTRKVAFYGLALCVAGCMASCAQQEIRRTDRGYRIPTYKDTTPTGSPNGSSQNKSSQNKSGSGVDPVKASSSGSSQNKP